MSLAFSELELLLRFPFEGENPTLIDVGAHEGGFSLPFAQRRWTILAFEPEELNREALKNNLHSFPAARINPCAVSDRTGDKVPFFVSKEHYGIHSLKPFHPTHVPTHEVETIRLDDALRAFEIDEVSLLKIDIEGADFLALQGFDFHQFRPELVMIEFMDDRSSTNFGYTHHDAARYMEKAGYTTFVSEWAHLEEYGRKGLANAEHQWLQCTPYPLDHEPAWGNLIFTEKGKNHVFVETLEAYLRILPLRTGLRRTKNLIKSIPGLTTIYKLLQR